MRMLTMSLIILISVYTQIAPAMTISLGASESPASRHMREETARYIPLMFTGALDIRENVQDAAIIAGTPESNPLIHKAIADGVLTLPNGKNADQGYAIKTTGDRIYVAGATDVGVLYGFYALLEAYGAYFQISGERLPEVKPFSVLPLDIHAAPVFKYRGLLPWDNFLCGMSGYNIEDYRDLITRATRMKFNMLQFHFYPGLVFFTETVDGETAPPQFVGAPVDVFKTKGAIGEAAFGDEKAFAPRPYVENAGDPRARAEACQAMLREALDFAHGYGFTTCVGFELMHPPVGGAPLTDKPDGGLNTINPLSERSAEVSAQRYESLKKTYPNADYYWMWQSEARGILSRQVGREPGAAEMREACKLWAGIEDFQGDIDYAWLFREVVKRIPSSEHNRIATGGWTIDHLFPGIEKEMPAGVTFASLNTYHPPTAQSYMPHYKVAESGRPTWMIEWWEFDGEQWFPQFRAGWQESMYDQCAASGVESVTLLGWKLSAVEHNVRYLADYAWRPGLRAEDFYKEYTARLYGPTASTLAERYLAYDAIAPDTPPATPGDDRTMVLGSGWMSLALPEIPFTEEGMTAASWTKTVERAGAIREDQRKLIAMDGETIAAFDAALPALDAAGKSWAMLMRNRLQFRKQYAESMAALNTAFIAYDETARAEGLNAAAVKASSLLEGVIARSKEAIQTYAGDIRNRGDLGVLAQLNEQYHKALIGLRDAIGGAQSPYLTLDAAALRLVPETAVYLDVSTPWAPRDGAVVMTPESGEGELFLRLAIGGDGARFHSVFMHMGPVNLEETPLLDIQARTASRQPVAIMFQVDEDPQWLALDLIGRQSLYSHLDGLPRGVLDDGDWHRLTWDLASLVADKLDRRPAVLRNVILGSWETPAPAIRMDVRRVAFGEKRTLD